MDSLSQSYEIQMDHNIGFGRQRSNTAQKLERLEIARRKAARIKNIKCDDSLPINANTDEANNLFVRKTSFGSAKATTSMLSEQLEKHPKQLQNKFLEYARFDGTSLAEVPTRTFKIFLTMLPEKIRNYPIQVCVISSTKIQDFIGLICYKCSIANPEFTLKSVKHYALYMTEDDGEVEMDFPALDVREPCSKFIFTHLALIERRNSDINQQQNVSKNNDGRFDRTMSIASEAESLSQAVTSGSASMVESRENDDDLARMLGHTSMIEAPLYRSFHVHIINKAGFNKVEVQLGISSEKLEIDPIHRKNTKFWTKRKPASHNMDSIASCEITEQKSSKAAFRVIYGIQYFNTASNILSGSSLSSDYMTSSPSSQHAPPTVFKHYDFETDTTTAQEIVDKVRHILEVRTSNIRREYLATKGHRK